MVAEPTEGIKLHRVELFGSGHDPDRDLAEVRAGGYEESALQSAGGDLEVAARGVDMSVWSAHTLYKTQNRSPICRCERRKFGESARCSRWSPAPSAVRPAFRARKLLKTSEY